MRKNRVRRQHCCLELCPVTMSSQQAALMPYSATHTVCAFNSQAPVCPETVGFLLCYEWHAASHTMLMGRCRLVQQCFNLLSCSLYSMIEHLSWSCGSCGCHDAALLFQEGVQDDASQLFNQQVTLQTCRPTVPYWPPIFLPTLACNQ